MTKIPEGDEGPETLGKTPVEIIYRCGPPEGAEGGTTLEGVSKGLSEGHDLTVKMYVGKGTKLPQRRFCLKHMRFAEFVQMSNLSK